ncbi:unnamed protein product [Moneuplotes crassus]|uniref:Uncharacterized protein n=1 Tax=Euplotes crassus TaxID=5936 RepID=A0AAD2DAU8_EUPCR|nr:unnamed protein product [Moneuplotes crassus]
MRYQVDPNKNRELGNKPSSNMCTDASSDFDIEPSPAKGDDRVTGLIPCNKKPKPNTEIQMSFRRMSTAKRPSMTKALKFLKGKSHGSKNKQIKLDIKPLHEPTPRESQSRKDFERIKKLKRDKIEEIKRFKMKQKTLAKKRAQMRDCKLFTGVTSDHNGKLLFIHKKKGSFSHTCNVGFKVSNMKKKVGRELTFLHNVNTKQFKKIKVMENTQSQGFVQDEKEQFYDTESKFRVTLTSVNKGVKLIQGDEIVQGPPDDDFKTEIDRKENFNFNYTQTDSSLELKENSKLIEEKEIELTEKSKNSFQLPARISKSVLKSSFATFQNPPNNESASKNKYLKSASKNRIITQNTTQSLNNLYIKPKKKVKIISFSQTSTYYKPQKVTKTSKKKPPRPETAKQMYKKSLHSNYRKTRSEYFKKPKIVKPEVTLADSKRSQSQEFRIVKRKQAIRPISSKPAVRNWSAGRSMPWETKGFNHKEWISQQTTL